MKYWLMKSEPDEYGIEHLRKDRIEMWGGVRNYQARNFMRDEMKVGDAVLFYHSNADPSGVAGLARISGEAEPDPTAFDPQGDYFDPKSDPENPRWVAVKVEYVATFPSVLSLAALRENPKLAEMLVLRKGQRLSVQPVSAAHFKEVCRMGKVDFPR